MVLKSKDFIDGMISANNNLQNNKEYIDKLNVFPVPDGDTGSNMAGTMKSAIESIVDIDKSLPIEEVGKIFSRGALMGARGNSGVILSQIFRGIISTFVGKKELKPFDLVESLKAAKKAAYKSVINPIEGTMLTVIKIISEEIELKITNSSNMIDVFSNILKLARKACDLTTSMLPVLKEVGVTDSGGEGIFLIFEGFLDHLKGQPVKIDDTNYNSSNVNFENHEVFDGEFGYCTEFVLELKKKNKFNKEKYEADIVKLGNSIVVVQDEELLRTHIHADKPGTILNFAQKFGEFIKIKADNMTIQANQSKTQKIISSEEAKNKKVSIGVISCNNGEGIATEMREFGVDFVIQGGQTQNPSTADFIEGIKQINSDKIIILPNNSNIILVAQQVAQTMSSDKTIIIIPTKNQVEGYVAMMNFNSDNSLEENKTLMLEGIKSTRVGKVTKAIKDVKLSGVKIKEGEHISILGKDIISSKETSVDAAIELVKKITNDDTEVITIWYGSESNNIDAEEIESYIKINYDVDVEVKNGKQDIYHFLIGFE